MEGSEGILGTFMRESGMDPAMDNDIRYATDFQSMAIISLKMYLQVTSTIDEMFVK